MSGKGNGSYERSFRAWLLVLLEGKRRERGEEKGRGGVCLLGKEEDARRHEGDDVHSPQPELNEGEDETTNVS